MATPVLRKVVVFSGGSAANSLVDVFNGVIEKNNCSLGYVIPISDNGGSSSELIRVFGGPGIGDVRSMFVGSQFHLLLTMILFPSQKALQVNSHPCRCPESSTYVEIG